MSKPTHDWQKVGERFYRKVQLYTSILDQDIELENYFIAGAPYSGAVALYRDERKFQLYRTSQGLKPTIDIYSCSGKLIQQINWDAASIRGIGWSEDEKLLVISEDGTVRRYLDFYGDFTQFTLGNGVENYGVSKCLFWSTGFVALLENNQLVAVSRYDEPRPKLLAAVPQDGIASWAVLPPIHTLSQSVEVLVSMGETIYVVDASDCEDRNLQRGPFRHIVASPNGRFIALYTDDGKVWVISSDFQNKLSDYDSGARTVPRDMQWCGNNGVVLAWEDEVHIVGPNGAASKFYYDGCVQLLADVDGIRIFTNEVCEFLQKVPDVTEDVFKLGSTSPAAVLLDALDHLETKSPKADDNIQMIRPQLDEAVDTCIRAAAHEYSVYWQKQLLKAASFGKSVLHLYNSDEFVDTCETLRVLNSVRSFEIGLPLSYDQYLRLTPENLVERLINRHEYLLALRVSEYLRLPTDKIHVHWACQKVRISKDDESTISRLIVNKLQVKNGISFEEIARTAFHEGRTSLATELLNYEPRAGKQVPLLLSMEQETVALDKAIESGDTDLIFYVLLQLKKKLPLAAFFRTLNTRPTAAALVEASALDQDRELLKDFYYQDDRRLDGSSLLLLEALDQTELGAKVQKLKFAGKLIQDTKEHSFNVRAIDEAQRLLRMQDAFEKDLDAEFAGKSVYRTAFDIIKSGNSKRAQRLLSEFKVPEKSIWWLRLRALVARRDWNELEEISRLKKSPIDWEPFFDEILSAGNIRLAAIFIPKCTLLSVPERIDMWLKCSLPVKAAEEAFRAKNMKSLEQIKQKSTGNATLEIERLINQLANPRR